MTATERLNQTPMPYIKLAKNLDVTKRITREIDVKELQRLLEESRKGVHDSKTLPSMQAVRP